MTKTVKIGNRIIGGGNPILIQSMTNTKTENVEATAAQINQLTAAGCDIILCSAYDGCSEGIKGDKKTGADSGRCRHSF